MAIVLGPNRYGKAESRVVRIQRDTPRHEIRDLNVSTALRGWFDAAHIEGDQSAVLPTDSQKQTVYAYAKQAAWDTTEEYALTLARHFVDDIEPVDTARVEIEEYAWERVTTADGAEHDHTWVRRGPEVRTVAVTVSGAGAAQRTWVVGGVKDLTILKSTGSEFRGFLQDPYTVLEPAADRVMATSLVAGWRFSTLEVDWDEAYASIRQALVATFANLHSLALQQTLYAMGRAVLEACPEVAEIRLSAPNKHHFAYDLARFGIENRGEIFHAADRPYGLIQATVMHDDAEDAGPAWESFTGLV
ncbi:urate oxidase [Actinospica sp. MGRD01-02]|uniref:Uricase n=1 Tax=Actinospica acidithermotolerans TaxID=2828514 RepID=A0A941EAB7_9ACTN|nr:urate oxidase [Actinospica acidithermotolerans]MBR7829145.1 urate oxidase [Actinospica acidithermotolerans]